MNIHHTISYVEISVTDLARARAFYEQAFGWRFNDYGPDYAGIQAPDGRGEVGGLGVGRAPGPGGSAILISSDDLPGSLEAVRAAGGAVTEEPLRLPGWQQVLLQRPRRQRARRLPVLRGLGPAAHCGGHTSGEQAATSARRPARPSGTSAAAPRLRVVRGQGAAVVLQRQVDDLEGLEPAGGELDAAGRHAGRRGRAAAR